LRARALPTRYAHGKPEPPRRTPQARNGDLGLTGTHFRTTTLRSTDAEQRALIRPALLAPFKRTISVARHGRANVSWIRFRRWDGPCWRPTGRFFGRSGGVERECAPARPARSRSRGVAANVTFTNPCLSNPRGKPLTRVAFYLMFLRIPCCLALPVSVGRPAESCFPRIVWAPFLCLPARLPLGSAGVL